MKRNNGYKKDMNFAFVAGIIFGILVGTITMSFVQPYKIKHTQYNCYLRDVDCGPTKCAGVWSGATEIICN